jgi:hypothetical protein
MSYLSEKGGLERRREIPERKEPETMAVFLRVVREAMIRLYYEVGRGITGSADTQYKVGCLTEPC